MASGQTFLAKYTFNFSSNTEVKDGKMKKKEEKVSFFPFGLEQLKQELKDPCYLVFVMRFLSAQWEMIPVLAGVGFGKKEYNVWD